MPSNASEACFCTGRAPTLDVMCINMASHARNSHTEVFKWSLDQGVTRTKRVVAGSSIVRAEVKSVLARSTTYQVWSSNMR